MRAFLPVLASVALGCVPVRPAPSAPSRSTTVPVEFVSLIPFVPVEIDGRGPYAFIFDSGMLRTNLDRRVVEALGMTVSPPRRTAAPGGEVEVSDTPPLTVTLGGHHVKLERAGVLDLEGLEPFVGRRIDGIIGHDVFRALTLQLDYQRATLTVTAPEDYQYAGDGEAIPLELTDHEPFVHARVSGDGRQVHEAKLKPDTGSLDTIGFNGSFVQGVKLFPPGHRRVPAPGVAVGGETKNFIAILPSFALGRFEVRNLVVGYSEDLTRGGDAGTFGGELLRRFRPTFDYARRRMILEDTGVVNEPARLDRSGLIVVSPVPFERLVIAAVLPGSAAEAAGLRAGDVVIALNGTRPASLSAVREALQERGPFTVTYEREGAPGTAIFTGRDLL